VLLVKSAWRSPQLTGEKSKPCQRRVVPSETKELIRLPEVDDPSESEIPEFGVPEFGGGHSTGLLTFRHVVTRYESLANPIAGFVPSGNR